MPKFILSGPGSQQTEVEAINLEDAYMMARRFKTRYGIIGDVDVYDDGCVAPAETIKDKHTKLGTGLDDRPVYHFIYCASEQGSLTRRCDDDTAARKHAHILADAHGETCHVGVFARWPKDEVTTVGTVEPRIPKN